MSRIRSTLALLALSAFAAGATQAQDFSIAQLVAADGRFSTLARLVEVQGLGEALVAAGSVTLLAPTNEAFAALPAGQLDELLKPANKAAAAALVGRHIVPGALGQEEIKRRRSLTAQSGEALPVRLVNGRLRIGDARVVGKDAKASNGVVVALDAVLTQ